MTAEPPPPASWSLATAVDLPPGYEFVGGRLIEKPASGGRSSWVAGQVFSLLYDYCERTGFGLTFVADLGFRCFPAKPTQVRKPDVSVIRCVPAAYALPRGWAIDVPTLVVEVVSPNELATDLAAKVSDFRAAGTPLVWVIVPDSRQATIYRADGTVALVAEPADLSGENVLPGLVVPLAAVLPAVRPAAP